MTACLTTPENLTGQKLTFLRTIRQALGKSSAGSHGTGEKIFSPRPDDMDTRLAAWHNRTPADQAALLSLLTTEADRLDIKVVQVPTPADAGKAIQELVQQTTPEWGNKKSVIAWDHPLINALNLPGLLTPDQAGIFITQGSGHPDTENRNIIRRQLIKSYIGITAVDFCIAESATLVLRTRPGQPRAVSLVPSIHVAVVCLSQIISSLKELYARLLWDPEEAQTGLTNCMTFITGPSKTADIELEMVQGAHGPRQVWIYLISGSGLPDCRY